jgi:serine/threonine protein kinase
MKSECPSHDELRQLLADLPPGEQAARLTDHLEACECCQQALEELATAGTNLSQLIEQVHQSEPVANSAFWPALRSVSQAAGFAPTIAPPTIPRTKDSSTAFLLPPSDPAYLGRLDQFEVMRVIGRGGMGIVLEAFDTKLQRPVALKVLDPDLAHDETSRKRFCREARAAASITHENVVAVHQVEHAASGELPYLVMQLISGETLEQRLLRERQLPLKEIVRINLQLVHGLAAAHAQGLVHRDIKPGNILLEPPHNRVKLADFGLARIADDVKLTRTGFVTGTPLYMAPEQAMGQPGDARSDLFSVGAIMYEMCAGQPPFQGDSALAIMKQITDVRHRPLRELNPDIPDWLAEMVDDLLAKKPEDRYQSAADLAEVLEYAWTRIRTSSDELPAVCQVEQQQRRKRTRNIIVGVGLAFLALGILAGMLVPWRANEPSEAESSAEPVAVLAANAGSAWSVSFDPASDTVAMAVEDGSVRLWDLRSKTVQETFEAHRGVVWSSQLFDGGKLLATTGDDGLLKIWNRAEQEPLKTFEHPNAVRGLAISREGKLYAGDRAGGLYVWSLESDSPLATVQQPGAIYTVAVSPDGKTLATAGTDKVIRLWSADSLKQRLVLEGHSGPVYGVSFSADGKTLASAGWDDTIRLWDPAAGTMLKSWNGEGGDIWSIAFSPTAPKLATGNSDGSVRLWDAESGTQLASFLGHDAVVHTVAFNDDGSLLGSGGRDGAVRVWPIK